MVVVVVVVGCSVVVACVVVVVGVSVVVVDVVVVVILDLIAIGERSTGLLADAVLPPFNLPTFVCCTSFVGSDLSLNVFARALTGPFAGIKILMPLLLGKLRALTSGLFVVVVVVVVAVEVVVVFFG